MVFGTEGARFFAAEVEVKVTTAEGIFLYGVSVKLTYGMTVELFKIEEIVEALEMFLLFPEVPPD